MPNAGRLLYFTGTMDQDFAVFAEYGKGSTEKSVEWIGKRVDNETKIQKCY
jgi:hypothetical protein